MSGSGSTENDRCSSPASQALLWLGLLLCLVPWSLLYPPLDRFHIEFGLGLGILLALSNLAHAGPAARKASKILIQVCVVLLGFRMNLHQVYEAGRSGLLFAVGTIVGVFALGFVLGRLLRTDGKITTLLNSGTAICGGSAIAAVSSVIGATGAQIGVATAIVFILNGLALYLFPYLGHQMSMSADQFGTWAGVAIHDISSVVGAAQSFDHAAAPGGPLSADTATVVKLTRVLWIVPICIAASWWVSRAQRAAGSDGDPAAGDASPATPVARKLPIPWFIALFLLAAGVRTLLPSQVAPMAPWVAVIAKSGMAAALFLIGLSLSRKAMASVGWRPFALGIALWVFISVAALIVVRATVQ